MPVPVDALNLATIHLLPKLEQLFFDDHIFLRKIIEGGLDRRRTGGEYAAFDVAIDGPGTVAKLLTGAESYSYGRRNIVRQARVYIPTHIYSWAVEGEALRHAHGPTGIENLLKLYPRMATLDYQQRTVAQMLTGNGAAASIDGFVTLNGDTTYNPDGTALNGILDFQTRATQTDTVENLVKEAGVGGITGWYNQFGSVTSFATDGKDTMRAVYNACRIRSAGYGPPDIGLTDATSFNNYYRSLDDQVRYSAPRPKTQGEEGVDAGDLNEGLMFHNMALYEDPSIDDNTAQFTTATVGGVFTGIMYFLNTKTWFMLSLGGDAEYETKGMFDVRGPFKLEGRDAWGWENVTAFQLACRFLKANGCLVGSALV